MDSISRYCLLAYLKANPDMTYKEIVQFIERMQPMEVDGGSPTAITLTVEDDQLEEYTKSIQAALSQSSPITAYKNEDRDTGITDHMIPGVVYQYWPSSMG